MLTNVLLRVCFDVFTARPKKSGCGLGLGELLKILGFPYDIYATAGASDFKFGMLLEFAKAQHKTTPKGKVGVALGYGSSQIYVVLL